jgi:hypothetical protein
MRFLLMSVLFVGSAFAQTTGRDLKDLMWIPSAGRIYGVTEYLWDGAQVNVDKTTEVDIHNEVIEQSVGFGLTDLISAELTYARQLKGQQEQFTSGGTGGRTTVDTEGMQNPTVAGTWRLMEQSAGRYAVDVRASYSPDLVDNEGSDNDTEYTAGAGGAVYQVGARLGQKNGTSQWNAQVIFLYAGESESENTAGDKETTDATYTVKALYGMQEQMLDFLDFRGEVALQRTSGYDSENAGSADTQFDPQWVATLGTTFLISVIKDTLVVSPGISIFYASAQDAETSGTTQEYRDYKGYTATLSALYQF